MTTLITPLLHPKPRLLIHYDFVSGLGADDIPAFLIDSRQAFDHQSNFWRFARDGDEQNLPRILREHSEGVLSEVAQLRSIYRVVININCWKAFSLIDLF